MAESGLAYDEWVPVDTGIHVEASNALADEKRSVEQSRVARWFGKTD